MSPDCCVVVSEIVVLCLRWPGIVVFEVDYILLHSLVLLVLLVAQIEEARPGSGLMRLIQYSSNAEHPSD